MPDERDYDRDLATYDKANRLATSNQNVRSRRRRLEDLNMTYHTKLMELDSLRIALDAAERSFLDWVETLPEPDNTDQRNLGDENDHDAREVP